MGEFGKLKKKFDETISEIVKKFEKKQRVFSDDLDKPLEHIWFMEGLMFLTLSDIIFDLETDQPKGQIIEWFFNYERERMNGIRFINYKSYSMGAR